MRPIFSVLACLLLCVSAALGQVNTGELRLKVIDSSGAGLQATVTVVSEGNQYNSVLATDDAGTVDIQTLPYGIYQVAVDKQGFSTVVKTVEVRSALPVKSTVELRVAPLNSTVTINETGTLVDPDRPSSVMQIGAKQIEERVTSLPGRSVEDLVNTQPGWIYEGNAVLHPRGAEAQTQFVIDGIPLTDNRSPSVIFILFDRSQNFPSLNL